MSGVSFNVMMPLVFQFLLTFVVFALFAVMFDVLKVFRLDVQPFVKLGSSGLFFTLVNLIPLLPLVFSTMYIIWSIAAYPVSLLLSIYVLLVSLAIASTTIYICVVFTVFSIAVALSLGVLYPVALVATPLALSALAIRLVAMLLAEIPRVSIVFSHVTISPHYILVAVLTSLGVALLAPVIEKGCVLSQFLFSHGFFCPGDPTPANFMFITAVMMFVTLMPAFFNMANRYVDAYVWHIRVSHGISWRERVVKIFFYFSISTAIIALLTLFKFVNLYQELYYVLYLPALGVAACSLVLNKMEKDNDIAATILIYYMAYFGLSLVSIYGNIQNLSIYRIPTVGIYLLDLALAILLLALAIMLYEIPIRIKKILLSRTPVVTKEPQILKMSK
ncbi:MAG: hypothetical protein ACK4M3_00215 [Pyrobaculum sp.]